MLPLSVDPTELFIDNCIFILLYISRKDHHILTYPIHYDLSTLLTLITLQLYVFEETACSWYMLPQRKEKAFSPVIPLISENRGMGGEIWIRWMSEGLAWWLLIPLLQEWSRAHLETFFPLLFNTSWKALKRLSHTVWHTWCGADGMRCYQFE